MSKTYLFAVLLALTPAFPAPAAAPAGSQADAQSPTMPGGPFRAGKGFNNGAPVGRGGGKLAGLLTPQQRAAFVLQARDETRSMTPDQRKAWRKDQTRKLLSMSAGDRQKFTGALQARWDALPDRQKARLNQRLSARNNGQ